MTTRFRAILARGGCALAALAALGGACVSLAQTPVPAELNGWQSWALHGHENHACPWLIPGRPADEERVCAWPAVLDLQVDAHGARFTQHWEAAAEGWLPLPGSTEDWPENVTLDGKAAAVVAQHGAPVVRVATGSHAIAGTFSWARRPELLAVPASVALLQLSVDGARVMLPQRSSAGVVLGAQAVAREDNRLEVRVFRLLADSLPASLTTQLQLVVAGEGREIHLPQVLPQGFIPTSVDGALAARLDPDNTLRVQVRPGEFELTIEARGPSPATEVRLGALPAPWPANEIWSFRAQDRLRVVTVDGVAALDPVQANVPPPWMSEEPMTSSVPITAAIGCPPPANPLPSSTMSGSRFHRSLANIVPQRPMHVWTSSRISFHPHRRHIACSRSQNGCEGDRMPPSPRTGSIRTPAI